jgi:hypothetical protein
MGRRPKIEHICVICGQTRRINQCTNNNNEYLKEGFVVCKDCANERTDLNDNESVRRMCQFLNIAYVQEIVDKVVLEEDDPNMGHYLRYYALRKDVKLYSDSIFSHANDEDVSESNMTTAEEMAEKWGKDYKDDEYSYFESQLKNLIAIKEPKTQFELKRYIQNVKLEYVLNQALQDGDAKTIPNLRKTYNDDLKDLGFDSVLNAKDNGSQSLGERIQHWEDNKPIPDKDEFEDVSGVKQYIQKWFIIPMKRTFGQATEEEVSSLYDGTE